MTFRILPAAHIHQTTLRTAYIYFQYTVTSSLHISLSPVSSATMAYYDTIKTPSAFIRRSSSEGAANFLTLSHSPNCGTAASHWGRKYLFACRAICGQESMVLPFLANRIRSGMENGVHDCITALLRGPREDYTKLSNMSELQIIRAYENESLGYVWAALALLQQRRDMSLGRGNAETENLGRPTRDLKPIDRFGEVVPSGDIQIGSSPPLRSDSSSSEGSIGYLEEFSAPLVEDFTIRFVSCLIRCVLNYAQPVDKNRPFVLYRDERLEYHHLCVSKRYEAIDDGGVQLWSPGRNLQVALVEAKRNFQTINEGRPTLSDELLGQVVGEALAARIQGVDEEPILISPEK
ncbi:hypothetical protein FQN55_007189 [Onygenales sp. PD_40]|nr:hypothetical protein FQN55_007189 [Onygenales sp. PD_40]